MSAKSVARISGISTLAVAVAVVAVSLGAAPAPAAPESGARLCGFMYRAAQDPAHPDMVQAVQAYVMEVDKDSGTNPGSLCYEVIHHLEGKLGIDDTNIPWSSNNTWNKIVKNTCESVGNYLASDRNYGDSRGPYNTDICEYMNKSSGASGDQHTYLWKKKFAAPVQDPAVATAPGETTCEQIHEGAASTTCSNFIMPAGQ